MEKLVDKAFLLKHLLSSTTDMIYFKDLQSRYVKVNPACAQKHGFSDPDEMTGKTDFDLYTRDHAEKTFAVEQNIIRSGIGVMGMEERETWTDGHVTWGSSSKIPMKNEQGAIIGTFGITRDITAIKLAEMKARQYWDEMRRIKENMEDDLLMAGRLQQTFFPKHYPAFPPDAPVAERCVEFYHTIHLTGEVSGDYCTINARSETAVEIFLCAVQGGGLRAALGTALIRGIAQELTAQQLEPGDYLSHMNDRLIPLLHHDELKLEVTACHMLLDLSTGRLKIADAAHPVPIHVLKGGGAKRVFENLAFCGPPLAAQPEGKYPTVEVGMAPGDRLLLFTEGLYDMEGPSGRPFGETRLLQAAAEVDAGSLKAFFEALQGRVLSFSREKRFKNDTCLVGFQLNRLTA